MKHVLKGPSAEQVTVSLADIAWVMHGKIKLQEMQLNRLHNNPELSKNAHFIQFHQRIDAYHDEYNSSTNIENLELTKLDLSNEQNEFAKKILALNKVLTNLREKRDEGNASYHKVVSTLKTVMDNINYSGDAFFNAPTNQKRKTLAELKQVITKQNSLIKSILEEHPGN